MRKTRCRTKSKASKSAGKSGATSMKKKQAGTTSSKTEESVGQSSMSDATDPNEGSMSLMEHLTELRNRIGIVLLFLL